MKNRQWTLINNNSHKMTVFSSEKKLRLYAYQARLNIKRSYTDTYSFYTISYQYIPGNQ